MQARRILGLVAAVVVTGCAPSFGAVNPTILALRDLGYRCGDGVKDNVPSGLYQWHCDVANDGSIVVLVNGNASGIAEIDVAVATNDPAATRAAYQTVATKVTPLMSVSELARALDSWSGSLMAQTIGGIRVAAECDTTCIVFVSNASSPLEPLPIP